MLVGYARVSTDGRNNRVQVAALRRAGCRRVFGEKRSGVGVQRPVLSALVGRLGRGDVLCACKLDRLARSLVGLLALLQEIEARGAAVRSLTEPFDTSQPLGRLMVQLLGAFAEWERAVIRERCQAGRVAAKARGVRFGRPRLFDYSEAAALRARGLTWAEVGLAVGRPADSVRLALRLA